MLPFFQNIFIKEIKELQICKRYILYSWDSIKVYPQAINMHKYFDEIYSFDSDDVKNIII